MKRLLAFAAIALVACAAGLAGAYLKDAVLSPDSVQAQGTRPDKGIRIALFNLEEAARQSPKFQELRNDWERIQRELEGERERSESEFRAKRAELQAARIQGASEDQILGLEVELQARKETIEAQRKMQQQYLGALLNKYQTDVLREVMHAVQEYVRLERFDLVLQDYTVEDATEADFFSGGAYAQTMLNKSVLYAPGMTQNQNAYVTNITRAVIQRMGG